MRALKTKIKGLRKQQFNRLKVLTGNAKNLYNQALWTLKEAFEATGLYYTYPQMDKVMKQVTNLEGEINYRLLKSKVSQQILRKLDKNFKGFFRAFQDFKKNPSKYKGKPKPPRFKLKKLDNLIYDYQCFQISESLSILKTHFEIKTFKMSSGKIFYQASVISKTGVVKLEKGLEIKIPDPLIGKVIKQVEIIPKNHSFHAVFVYDDEQTESYQKIQLEPVHREINGETQEVKEIVQHEHVMSIDLGLNNLATVVTTGVVKPFIIDGRRLKSINAFYNKTKAKIQSQLQKANGVKWSQRLQTLTDKRNARVKDYIHRATHTIVETCLKHNISKVVVGDLAKSLSRINLGKKTNQNFVNLALGQFVDKLGYKLGSHGIELVVTDESYTSKASFVDSDKMPKRYNPKTKNKHTFSGQRIKRGLYKTNNGTLINADVNGAFNILRKNDPNFSYNKLLQKVGTKINQWLHPTNRIRFFLKKKHSFAISNPKWTDGEGIKG